MVAAFEQPPLLILHDIWSTRLTLATQHGLRIDSEVLDKHRIIDAIFDLICQDGVFGSRD